MRVKIAMIFEDDISQALMIQAEQTLTDIAVAFGHTFILKTRKNLPGCPSRIRYGIDRRDDPVLRTIRLGPCVRPGR